MGDGFHQRGQGVARHGRFLQPFSQPRQDRYGIVSLAVHEAVDGLLQALAKRMEENGDHSGSQNGEQQIATGLEQDA